MVEFHARCVTPGLGDGVDLFIGFRPGMSVDLLAACVVHDHGCLRGLAGIEGVWSPQWLSLTRTLSSLSRSRTFNPKRVRPKSYL